jgi:hypothetical protein
MNSVTLPITQDVNLTATQVDDNGPIIPQDASYTAPAYVVADPTIGTVNGFGTFIPVAVGSTTVTGTSSKSGSTDIVGVIGVTVVGPTPTALQISAGTPFNK